MSESTRFGVKLAVVAIGSPIGVVGGEVDADLLRDPAEDVGERRHREHRADRLRVEDDRADREEGRPAAVDDDLAQAAAAHAVRRAQRLPERAQALARGDRRRRALRADGEEHLSVRLDDVDHRHVRVRLERSDEPVQRRPVAVRERLRHALRERDLARDRELFGLDVHEGCIGAGARLHEPPVEGRARAGGRTVAGEDHGEHGDGDPDDEMELPPPVPAEGPFGRGRALRRLVGPREPGILGHGHRGSLEAVGRFRDYAVRRRRARAEVRPAGGDEGGARRREGGGAGADGRGARATCERDRQLRRPVAGGGGRVARLVRPHRLAGDRAEDSGWQCSCPWERRRSRSGSCSRRRCCRSGRRPGRCRR